MGRFSDSPYFLLQTFFDGLNNTEPLERPIFDLDWPVDFLSSIDNNDGTRSYTDDAFTFLNSDDGPGNVTFTNYRQIEWNLKLHYDTNIVQTFNSYIVAPMVNITTKGGGLLDLFVKEKDEGYKKINVRFKNIIGNEFNFENSGIGQYAPGETITQELSGNDNTLTYTFRFWDKVAQDTFNIFSSNRECYFRKDSLYHDWLRLMAQDHLLEEMGIKFDIRQYVNSDKLFSYFHNIFKSHDNQECRIIFDGMKDYVMRAVPEHQRTPAFTELCNVFFDQLYQEIYDMLKNIWSLIDPMEVDARYLGYLSKYYDMFDVEVEAPLLQIREFIRDMIWMIKRKGTYTEFYILWRILTATKNVLSIYERWHRKDVENFPEWPGTISPPCTGTWPNFPYYSGTNPELPYPKYYGGEWPPPSGVYHPSGSYAASGTTTVVPPSAWQDVLYIYRDEYEAPEVDFGAGPGWYKKWYPNVYDTGYTSPSASICPSGGFMNTPLDTDIAPSGAPSGYNNLMLSTHYILETDITSEPLTRTEILTEGLWNQMREYWEYVRPVNRVSNYRILIAPITDMSKQYINLYQLSNKSSAFLKTKSYTSFNLEENSSVKQIDDPSTIWNINHKLGSKDILVQVFDFDYNEIIPKSIDYNSESTVVLNFEVPEAGFAIIRMASWTATRQDPVIDDFWEFYHQRNNKNIIVHYKLDDNRFYSKGTVLLNSVQASAGFNDLLNNTAMVGSANYVHTQLDNSLVWNVNHELETKGVLTSVYDNEDNRIHPKEFILDTDDACRLVFDSDIYPDGVSGYAVFIAVGDLSPEDVLQELENTISNVTFIVYTHDSNGNREIVDSGDLVITYHDDDYYYFDLILSKNVSYTINEIELYDDYGNILFHSLMSNLYKPYDDMTFHYRLSLTFI